MPSHNVMPSHEINHHTLRERRWIPTGGSATAAWRDLFLRHFPLAFLLFLCFSSPGDHSLPQAVFLSFACPQYHRFPLTRKLIQRCQHEQRGTVQAFSFHGILSANILSSCTVTSSAVLLLLLKISLLFPTWWCACLYVLNKGILMCGFGGDLGLYHFLFLSTPSLFSFPFSSLWGLVSD